MSMLSEIRTKLSRINVNELDIVDKQPALLEMWQQMQVLRDEMNKAKKLAVDEVAKPYLEAIADVEKQYAVLLRLSA